MSLELIDNQPVNFDFLLDTCVDDNLTYAQAINAGDVSQFQFGIAPCSFQPDDIFNGNFLIAGGGSGWNLGLFWSIAGGQLLKTSGGVDSTTQDNVFITGNLYLIEIDVAALTIKDTGFLLEDGTTEIGNITQVGVNRFIHLAQNTTFDIASVFLSDTIAINSVSVIALPAEIIVSIWDGDSVFQTSFDFASNPENFEFISGFVNISVDWQALGITTAGCYFIGVSDPCQNTNGQHGIYNGGFQRSGDEFTQGWVFTPSNAFNAGSVTGGEAVFANTAPGTVDMRNTKTVFKEGLSYDVTFDLAFRSGTATIQPILGGAAGTVRSVAGQYTETIVCGAVDTDLAFLYTGGAVASGIRIDNVIITLTNVSDVEANFQSNRFDLDAHTCHVLLSACNSSDAFGMGFTEGEFTPRIRMKGRIVPDGSPFDIEGEIERNSDGSVHSVFYDRQQKLLLVVENQPLFIHKFLSLLRGMDSLFIDSKPHFISSSGYPSVRWNRDRTLGNCELEISVEELVRKVLCAEEDAEQCFIGEGVLLEPELNGLYVTHPNGEAILI